MFNFDISDELKILISRLIKKDKRRSEILQNKMDEIIHSVISTIDHYPNCSYSLKEYKHVHIDKSFVLLFSVDKNNKYVYFYRLGHHDDFFKK
jgi:mRNA-degrading endonuclease YafQ of YafQ-DinJ toxin-antitoxin module